MRRSLVLALAALVVAPLAAPAAPRRLAPRLAARIDAVMKPWTGTDRPGCAVAVVQDGAVTLARGYGMADLERRVPITPDTVFDLGSTSKQLTAAAVLLLVQDGRLSLDDDVRTYLPELPRYDAPITIRHLLHHTSGLRDYLELLLLGGHEEVDHTTAAQALAAIVRQRGLNFTPGREHLYSNTGYFLLSQIVERVSQRSMAEVARARIFAPLGMTHTHVHDDHTRLVPDRAIGYAPGEGGAWQLAMSSWEQTGDGAVMSTVRDLARWDANFDTGTVGGKPLLDGLQQRGTLADGTVLDYAAGLMLGTYRGARTVRHGGAWAGYRAELLRFPDQRTSFIVLCNAASSDPAQLADALADVVLGPALAAPGGPDDPVAAPVAITLAPAQLDGWAGTYWSRAGGEIWRFTREGDGLVLADRGAHLVPIDDHTFVVRERPEVRFTFTRVPGGSASVTLRNPRRTVVAERASGARLRPRDTAALAGRYTSAELAIDWTLAADGDRVLLRAPGVPPHPLEPLAPDVHASELGLIRIARRAGRVTGFTLDLGRTRGIAFARQP